MSMKPEDFQSSEDQIEDVELYDHERVAISKVYAALGENIGKNRTLASFEQEIIERMGEIGFRVAVDFYEATDPQTNTRSIMPQISILGRVEKEELFDHDRQAFEVQTDTLGVRKGEDLRASKPVAVSGFSKSKGGLYVPKR